MLKLQKKISFFLEKHNLKLPNFNNKIKNSKKLKGYKNLFSIRLKDKFRIIYKLDGNQLNIITINNRDSVYDKF